MSQVLQVNGNKTLVNKTGTENGQKYTQYTLPRRFKPDSKLHKFLAEKEPATIQSGRSDYTLFTVLSALRQVISREKLYDPNNTTVIICSEQLESALDVKCLHVTEIRDVVLKQMDLLSPALASLMNSPTVQQQPTTNPANPASGGQQQNGVNKFGIDDKFWVKPHFMAVLRKVVGVNPNQVVFTYREITSYLSQYILDNKAKFFDDRNIKIAHVENDPLGKAFGVKAFHRTQVTALLRNQLIPFNANKVAVKPTETTCQRVEISNTITPSRKRSSDSKDELVERRVRRRNSSGSLRLVKKDAAKDSDEESIYSLQGYNTATVGSEGKENQQESSDNESETAIYEVEYEPENSSGSEAETSPSRKDKKRNRKESTDTDSDIEDVVIEIRIREDSESEETSLDEASSDEDPDFTRGDLENTDYWKCLDCKQPNTPYIRYCSACYKERKGWLPERPKPKRKRNSKNSKDAKSKSKVSKVEKTEVETEASTSSSKTLEVSSQASSESGEKSEMSSQDSGYSEEAVHTQLSSDEETGSGTKALPPPAIKANMLCTICCAQPKNACLIHGRISHQVCCYGCAKKLFKSHRGCPVCRRKIEKITKNIIA